MTLFRLIRNKRLLWHVIFESNDRPSKRFDLMVMAAILLSIGCSFMESTLKVDDLLSLMYSDKGDSVLDMLTAMMSTPQGLLKLTLIVLEYFLTFFFAVEYGLRVWCSPNRREYIFCFFGVIDFLATFPTLFGLIFPDLRYMALMRTFRLIRIFRVLKLFAFINEGYLLLQSIKKSLTKISVYFLFVIVLVIVIGTLMFIVEGHQEGTGFTSIPASIYWAVVTLTTVGYGDITPVTQVGRLLSSLVMILGYTIIAVPTGIVSATMIDETQKKVSNGRCPRCDGRVDSKDNYCRRCGEKL